MHSMLHSLLDEYLNKKGLVFAGMRSWLMRANKKSSSLKQVPSGTMIGLVESRDGEV